MLRNCVKSEGKLIFLLLFFFSFSQACQFTCDQGTGEQLFVVLLMLLFVVVVKWNLIFTFILGLYVTFFLEEKQWIKKRSGVKINQEEHAEGPTAHKQMGFLTLPPADTHCGNCNVNSGKICWSRLTVDRTVECNQVDSWNASTGVRKPLEYGKCTNGLKRI